MARNPRGTAKRKLLDAAVVVIRRQGLSATSVDDLCAEAGVTKGAFFHHFPSKEALAVAAADHWSTVTGDVFAGAAYHGAPTAAGRVLGYLDFRASLIVGPVSGFTCLVGTMTQETHATHPAVRDACGASILGHAATLEADIEDALTDDARADGLTAAGLARHTQAVIQGAFILAKAADDPALAHESITHLRRYVSSALKPSGV